MKSGTRRPRSLGGLSMGWALLVAAGTAWGVQAPKPTGQPEKAELKEGKGVQEGKAGPDLASEESLARFAQLLERRPFHGPALEGLVKSAIDHGKLKELVADYKARSAALPDSVALKIVVARLQLRAGEVAEAAATLGGVEKLPADMARQTSDLLVLKAEVFQKSGNNAAAEGVLKEAVGLAGGVSEKVRLTEALADLYLRDSKKEEAVKVLGALAAEFPDNYLHQRQVAGALAQRGLHEAAVERYRGMLPLVKEEVDRKCETLRELGQSLEKLNKRDEAIEAYVEAVGLLGSDHWLQKDLHERIVALYRSGNRLADLAAYCEAQIKRSPEQTGMRVLLADVQAAMGKVDEGKGTLAKAVELFPKDLALSQKRVEFLERAGDVEGVAAEFQRAIGQFPADHELYIAYGQSLANSKQIEGARNQWRHVLSTKVEDAGLAVRLGALFEAYELYDDASEAYERAITANAKQPDAYAALARLWLIRGEPEKSAAALERMGEASPADASVQSIKSQGLRNLGKVPEALEAITKACELAPDQVKYQQIRSELLVQSGKVEEALEVRRLMVDRMTNPVQQAEAIATLVSMFESADKLEGLKAAEVKRVAEKPGDAVALLILAKAADAERDFVEMRKRLEELLKADPGNEMGLRHLAKLQDATGDINGAVETYTKLIQKLPARARQSYEAIVDLKLRYQDRAGAIETLESMANADLTSAVTQSAVADQLVRMSEPEKSIPFYERALKIQPDRHESRLDYGKALVDAGRLDDAVKEFRAVATQRSDTDRAVEAIGKLHDTATQLGKLEELMDELQHEVEVDPGNTLVARALAQMLVRELEYGRAMELLDLVQKHNPRDVDLAMSRAEVLRRLARFEEAVEGYQKVLRFPQIDRDFVLGELGKTQFEAGQVDQARRLWKQVQNKLYAGSLLKNNGLVEEAIAMYEEGIRLKPDDYSLHRNLIGALQAAGKQPEALEAARRLLDLEPGNVANVERLAEAYLRAGNREGAGQVAARLFSADVGVDRSAKGGPTSGAAYQSFAMAMYQAQYAQYGGAYSYYGGGQSRSNLDRGVQFFTKNGLLGELEEVLNEQIAAQANNAVLKDAAADLFMTQLNKPERAMQLLRELETAEFPLERQEWLGQCSQRDWMRIKQYNLVASKPAIRDAELGRLEAKKSEELTRDELLEMAVIRSAQGTKDKAAELLERALKADATDTLALGMLTNLLVGAEKFKEAEPHARKLVELLGTRREKLHAETVERVRRDFVRSLPLEFQLRMNEALLSDIADKWTMGSGWNWYGAETTEAVGYQRAMLTLGTICAETERMEEARGIWMELAPRRGPDVDRWTMLGDTAQVHKQEDLAFEFYENALKAARSMAGDPLLQQIYTSNTAQMSWYGEQGGINKAFGSIVEAFSKRSKLVELYDFLRDTDQEARARKVAEQYKLGEALKPVYVKRVEEALAAFRASVASGEGKLRASPPYFAQVCKLAELYDRDGNWDEAQRVYEAYLAEFPDELGLLTLLGEVAEARLDIEKAIEWEKRVLECKTRLSKTARDWALRDLVITPALPSPMGKDRIDTWSWQSRWSRSRWSYGGGQGELDRGASWMRLAHLYLASKNTIAAGDALQRAVADAGARRDQMVRSVIGVIQQRQLTGKMLPVLRTLAVYAPTDERVQLAFAESLETAGKKELALEVCQRMLRRGLTDLGMLSEVQRKVKALSPEGASAVETVTVATVEAEVAKDPANLKNRVRLAKSYYYSLKPDKALEVLVPLVKEAPHLDDVHDLLVEVYTLKGDSEKLIEALKTKIDRLSDDRQRRTARWRLVDELLGSGKTDEALAVVKELGDPRDPRSYQRIGALLRYFGKFDEAIKLMEQAGKSRQANPWAGREGGDFSVAMSLTMKGDIAGAADKVLAALDEQARQQVQYGGAYAMYGMNEGSPFVPLEHFFALYPGLAEEIGKRLEAKRVAAPTDPQATKMLIAFNRSMGRLDKAEELMEQAVAGGAADQTLTVEQIDKAVRRKQFAKAIELAEKFIGQSQKPKLPPGMPAQYAGMMIMQSPRTMMVCKLGDVYWDRGGEGDKDKAFETYRQILDEKVEETRLAFATICLVRGRVDEAKKLVEEALSSAEVKPPSLLQFRAFAAALDGQIETAFDALVLAAAPGNEGDAADRFGGDEGSPVTTLATLAQRANLMDKFVAFQKERIKKEPNNWANYHELMVAYDGAGNPKEAEAVLEEAAANSALVSNAMNEKLSRRTPVASIDELISLYEKIIELSEKDVQAGQQQAQQMMYGGMRDFGSSASHYREQLGNLYWEKGDTARAEELWKERLNIQQSSSWTKLGGLYEERGAYDKAAGAYERAVELDPDNAAARIAAAQHAFFKGDKRGALKHLVEGFLLTSGADPFAGGRQPYYDPDDESGGRMADPNPMIRLAAEFAADVELSSYLQDGSLADRQWEVKLMLASLTGDWAGLERLLKARIDEGSPEPLVWRWWAKSLQRKGDWASAAKALDYLRRANLTSIATHREKLKLVLAGKQIKEAAAGTRQAQPGAQGPGAAGATGGYAQPYYSGYDEYRYGAQPNSLLPSVYVKLGDFAAAERCYLISSGGDGAESRLPALANLMWEQNAKERALELMRLSLTMSGDRYGGGRNMLPQYAAMLSEAGKAGEAVELLIRAYRWDSSSVQQNAYYGLMGYGAQEQPFEQPQEQALAQTLASLLRKAGTLDETMKRLAQEAAQDPGDARLGKLVLSLHKQSRKWAELRDMLATARERAKGDDLGLTMEQFHAECQLGRWDDALKLVDVLRKMSPQQAEQWAMHEVFVHLNRGDVESALKSATPLLAVEAAGGEDWQAQQHAHAAVTVLMAMRKHDELAAHLEKKVGAGELDDNGKELLFLVRVAQKQWEAACRLALEEFWRAPEAWGATDTWWRHLSVLSVRAGAGLKPPERAEDRALIEMVSKGPRAGVSAFEAIARLPGSSVDAMRGLVFAARLAGEDSKAVQANRALVDRLESVRQESWFTRPVPAVPVLAKRWITQLSQGGTAALAQGMGMTLQLGQVLGQSEPALVTYEGLWQAHKRLHSELLARAGEVKELKATLERDARTIGARGDDESFNAFGSYYTTMAGMPASMRAGAMRRGYYGGYSEGYGQDGDWRGSARRLLWSAGRLDELWREYEQLGARIPEDEAEVRDATGIALAKGLNADEIRRRSALKELARMRASDTPDLGAGGAGRNSWYYGYWYYGGRSEQDAARIRAALQSAGTVPQDNPDVTARPGGAVEGLLGAALVDPEVEKALLEAAKDIGPGWGATQTMRTVVSFHRAKESAETVKQLIERATGDQDVARSELLGDYVWACFKLRDAAALEKVLDAAGKAGPTLQNDVALSRLVLLRLLGDTAKAAESEAKLLAQCVKEPDNLHRPSPEVLPAVFGAAQSRERYPNVWRRAGGFRGRYAYPQVNGRQDLPTVGDLADALGVEYERSMREGDLTVSMVRSAYERHGLFADAARIAELETASLNSEEDKFEIAMQRVRLLHKAGKVEEALQAGRALAAALTGPSEVPESVRKARLSRLYRSPAMGQDYVKALEAITAGRNLDPACDAGRMVSVHCLYKLGRFDEAWAAWQAGARETGYRVTQEPTVFYAGIAAAKSGDTEAGKVLLREALYRYPESPLASAAREIIDAH